MDDTGGEDSHGRFIYHWRRMYPALRFVIYFFTSIAALPFITFVTSMAASFAGLALIATAVVCGLQMVIIIVGGVFLLPVILLVLFATAWVMLLVACARYMI
ncbi:hypothetical protein BX666DRAFT_2029283 [Dichotomocladium elegans]|nr:hypothetical protein BX666DRAFT_2029283 [Dichotomocladium elegans]